MPDRPPNPYSPGVPVRPSEFAGREEAIGALLNRFESSREGHTSNVFVEGEWGIGKTSLLDKLKPKFQEHGPVIEEDVAEGSAETQKSAFYRAAVRELLHAKPQGIDPTSVTNRDLEDTWIVRKTVKAILDGLQAEGYDIAVFMLDNLERAKPEFLNNIRDVFQRLGQEGARCMLVVAGKHLPGSGSDAAQPSSRFFDRLPLGRFSAEESLEAIKKPIQLIPDFRFTDNAARLIHDRADGHPYFLKAICSAVFETSRRRGVVDSDWLEGHWAAVEQSLEKTKFGKEFDALPEDERPPLAC